MAGCIRGPCRYVCNSLWPLTLVARPSKSHRITQAWHLCFSKSVEHRLVISRSQCTSLAEDCFSDKACDLQAWAC